MSRNLVVTGPTLATPRWAGDFLDPQYLIRGGTKLDAAQFNATDAVVVTVGAAGALAAATSVPVDALLGAVPSGTVLNFGTNKFARLTADAAAGATSITVAAIPTALVDNDTATYAGVGRRTVDSGTPVGRTIAERDAGTGFGPAVSTDDEIMLVAFSVYDVTETGDVDLVRPFAGFTVKENFLPGFSTWLTALKTAIRARYICVLGAD
jgi:hypothetical protein